MPRLVDRQFRAVRQPDRGYQTPALVGHLARDLDSLGRQLGEGGPDVIAHQVQLVVAVTVCGMDGQFGRGRGEDQPSSAGVDRRQLEDIPKERADLLCFRRKNDCVQSIDHSAILLPAALDYGFQPVFVGCRFMISVHKVRYSRATSRNHNVIPLLANRGRAPFCGESEAIPCCMTNCTPSVVQ